MQAFVGVDVILKITWVRFMESGNLFLSQRVRGYVRVASSCRSDVRCYQDDAMHSLPRSSVSTSGVCLMRER